MIVLSSVLKGKRPDMLFRSVFLISFLGILGFGEVLESSAQCDVSEMLGEWWTPDKDSKIKVYKKGDKYYGDIVWMEEPRKEDGSLKRDENNPDPDKRDRTIKGLTIFKDMECTEKNMLEDGTLYDPESGKEYSGWMTLYDDNTLKVRGYIGVSMIGRTEYFERVEE